MIDITLDPDLLLFMEAVTGSTYIIRDKLYHRIDEVLKTPSGERQFLQLIEQYINKHISALNQAGPSTLIPFTDLDKQNYFTLFHITEREIKAIVTELTTSVNKDASWALLKQNPIFSLFYCCIRFYSLQPKSPTRDKGLNSALIIYALAAYPSIFSKYFKQGGANDEIMAFAVDQASEKFTIKKTGNVLGMLATSIRNAYNFLEDSMKDMKDLDVIRFIQRIRNDQNSLIKKITGIYMQAYKTYSVSTIRTEYMDSDGKLNIDFDSHNNTNAVDIITRRIVNGIATSGIDISRIRSAAKLTQISTNELRLYLTNNIIRPSSMDTITKLINAILFEFLYTDKHGDKQINSELFLGWSLQLFKRTNSSNPNIVTIKNVLNEWSESTGIDSKYNREASRIAYRKAIFLYFIFLIQKFN